MLLLSIITVAGMLLGIEMAADTEQCKNMMSYVAWEQLSS